MDETSWATKREALAAREAKRRQGEYVTALKKALSDKNLAICVGSGVTLYSTAEQDGKSLDRMKWTGLIANGLDYYVTESHLKPEQFDYTLRRAYDDLEQDPQSLLHAAATMKTKLGDKFPTWLESVFGNLQVNHPEILLALKKLHENSAIIFTTNYDGLLEQYCNLRPIDGTNPDDLARFEQKKIDGVFHPHGHYQNAKQVVVDAIDYYRIENTTPVQETLKYFLRNKTVLFVGCGKGLEDPNMGQLLDWIGKQRENVGHNHCIFLLKGDEPVQGPLLHIEYGERREELAPFLENLLPNEHAPSEGTINDIPDGSERRKIHDWLEPLDQSKLYAEASDSREPDTGNWLLRNDKLYDWLRSPNSLLWLHGPEGSGKTVLCSSILNVVQEYCRRAELSRARDSFAYFYCTPQNSSPKVKNRNFLSTVITQLCPPNYVFPALRKQYQACTNKYPRIPIKSQELQLTLISILRQLSSPIETATILWDLADESPTRIIKPGETFLLVDALDRVPKAARSSYLNLLRDLRGDHHLQHLHILITSRAEPTVALTRNIISSHSTSDLVHVSIERSHIVADIRKFVISSVIIDLELDEHSPEAKLILNYLVDYGKGMFGWVSDQTEKLRQLEVIDCEAIKKSLPPYSEVPNMARIELPTSTVAKAGVKRPRSGTVQSISTHRTGFATSRPGRNSMIFENTPEDWSEKGETKADREDGWSRWSQKYECFLEDWIWPVIFEQERLLDEERLLDQERHPSVLNGRIKIALLHTGVDMKDPVIKGSYERIKSRSWIGENDINDEDGSGTHAAALLLKTAPNAHVYMARVLKDVHSSVSNTVTFTAEAIRWATDTCKVDIIVLPFAFAKALESIELAIRAAVRKNILVFAASSPNGSDGIIGYPASRQARVIAINSSDDNGHPSAFTPPPLPNSDNFATIGEDIKSSWLGKLERRLSGASVATVLAAGMASTILYYAWQKLPQTEDIHLRLRSWEGKRAIFKLIGRINEGQYSYICPWIIFQGFHQQEEKVKLEEMVIKLMLEALKDLEQSL